MIKNMSEKPEYTTKTTESVDELLNQVAQGTEFHFQSGLCGDWTLLAMEPDKAALHLITEGECWFGFPDSSAPVKKLTAGDIVFINQGISHFVSRSPVPNDVKASELPSFCQPQHSEGGVVCYDINSPSATTQSVFRLLPPWVILASQEQAQRLKSIITMIREETKSSAPGHQAIVQRLSDVLAIHLLRAVVSQGDGLQGPLAALQDRYLRPLVLAIIDEPGGEWSVNEMAEKAFLSTSAFADRCLKHTGLSPKKLVDQLRLQRARALLKNSDLPLELIAEQLGYQSATAFSRFFKKYANQSASEYRKSP
ncbi:AraC family transcriptional regulator [Idiomarina seosinensis]|nr:AraC family transcriptional regulator [Idiomarina seosinensis]